MRPHIQVCQQVGPVVNLEVFSLWTWNKSGLDRQGHLKIATPHQICRGEKMLRITRKLIKSIQIHQKSPAQCSWAQRVLTVLYRALSTTGHHLELSGCFPLETHQTFPLAESRTYWLKSDVKMSSNRQIIHWSARLKYFCINTKQQNCYAIVLLFLTAPIQQKLVRKLLSKQLVFLFCFVFLQAHSTCTVAS